MALALLCTVCNTFPAFQVPSYVWGLLGHNIVVTPQALSVLTHINVPYVLLERGDIVNKEITGAIVEGEELFLRTQISWLTLQKGWHSRAAVLVLSTKPDRNVFHWLWSIRIANVVFLTTTGLYAYNPFVNSIISVGEHVRKNLTDRWKDMQGRKISISMYESPISFMSEKGISLGSGLEGSALYELSKYWNMTAELKVTRTMSEKRNAEIQVLLGETDISFIAYSLLHGDEKLQFSSVIYQDKVCIVLQIPDKLRGWDILMRIYDWWIYVGFIGTFIVTNKALRLLAKKRNRKRTAEMVLRSMSSISIPQLPASYRERFILGSTMIFGFIIVTVYQASMFHFVRFNVRNHRMKTLMDLYQNDVPLRSNEIALSKFFLTWHMKEIRKLGKRITEDEDIQSALDNAGFVMREQSYHLLRDANLMREDVYVVEERAGSFTMAYGVPRGSPFLEPLTQFTYRVFEAGLYKKWRHMTVHTVARYDEYKRDSLRMRGLRLSDIEVAFVALFIGHGFSLLIFLVEVLLKYRSRLQMHMVWLFLKKLFNIIFC